MGFVLINGKEHAQQLRETLKKSVETLPSQPCLAVILVGEAPASQVYVKNKIKAAEKTGIKSVEHRMPADVDETVLEQTIKNLNNDNDVHGILLQLPLPKKFDSNHFIQMISPEKDVDGLTYPNIAKLVTGEDTLIPCTPSGSLHLIKSIQADLTGMHAVVIGRSLLFGKPIAQLLLKENCTVTQCHSRTKNLANICAQADILIAAVGRAEMVKKEWVKDGAIVIDVGINRTDEGKLVGDVDFEAVKEHTTAITPVPGGVGPMTIAYLLSNTVKAYKKIKGA